MEDFNSVTEATVALWRGPIVGQNLRGAVKLNMLRCALVSQADDAANNQSKRGQCNTERSGWGDYFGRKPVEV
ncbi:hypothetical protein [Acetobacterium sp.]|uniref:hypothetical protein n=1 Tax=Acetobacterium sp. TaxID=1872094 RepID=UPI003593EE46